MSATTTITSRPTTDDLRKLDREYGRPSGGRLNDALRFGPLKERNPWAYEEHLRRRRILRDRKAFLREEFMGRAVERRTSSWANWDRASRMYVVDTRIRDGRVQYGLAWKRDQEPSKWADRRECGNHKNCYKSTFRFIEDS